MPKLKTEKQKLYYNKVLKLHEEKGYSAQLISKLVPVAKQTVYNWLRIAQEEKENQEAEAMAKKQAAETASEEATPARSVEEEVKALRAENAKLKKSLAWESMRADAFDEMINIAESRFKISIRKKSGAKQ